MENVEANSVETSMSKNVLVAALGNGYCDEVALLHMQAFQEPY